MHFKTAKFTVQRPVPRVYSGAAAASDPGNYRSFYSGHTSLAFTALSTASVTLNRRYGLTWQPWVATAIVGASVAMERVLAGYHFYSDVVVGAVAGTLTGIGVARFHLRGPDALDQAQVTASNFYQPPPRAHEKLSDGPIS
jgi:membrane-associated phospholipid phosphatase